MSRIVYKRIRIDLHPMLRRSGWRACLLFVVSLTTSAACAQSLTVPEIVGQKDKWDKWVSDGTKLVIDGRFEGRAAQSFLMEKLPISFQTPRSNPLPERMQKGQRIEVSGRLTNSSGRLVFEVNRLTIAETDSERIRAAAGRIPADQPDKLDQLADQYEPIALFYDDQRLRAEMDAVRVTSFERKRVLRKGDFQKLWELTSDSLQYAIPPRLTAEVRFESLCTRWKQPQPNLETLQASIESNLPGWDDRNQNWDAQKEALFTRDPIAAYNAATDIDRLLYHRRLFRAVTLQLLLAPLKPDASNSLSIAQQIQELLPEESEQARRLELADISSRLRRIETLSRAELQQLADLLRDHDRDAEIIKVTDQWVRAQDTRFRNTGLSGLLRTADEYLFIDDRFQRPEHKQTAIELLQQAWAVADRESPGDAVQIAERLKRLGWERLKNRWITTSDIEKLPDDNIDLAVREGRVVKGMSTNQVTGILGQPARISRIASGAKVRELWIYDAAGSAGVVVQFLRSRSEQISSATVADVTRASKTAGPRR